jgi:hypothetical protein
MSTAILADAWTVINSEESFIPFYVPLAFWIAAILFASQRGIEFHKWVLLHNVHNLTAIALATASLYFNDDSIFNERIPILFSLSYFCVDLIDCIIRLDYAFTAHAFFCLTLGAANYTTPALRSIRSNSKACMFELSSPFLHLSKKTRHPLHFLLFVFVFTCCRMIWIPIIIMQVHEAGMPFPVDIRQTLIAGFYLLNCYWYFKMLRIVYDAATGKNIEEKKTV